MLAADVIHRLTMSADGMVCWEGGSTIVINALLMQKGIIHIRLHYRDGIYPRDYTRTVIVSDYTKIQNSKSNFKIGFLTLCFQPKLVHHWYSWTTQA